MKAKIENLVAELKKKGESRFSLNSEADPEAKVNVWYVIAKLEEALLEGKNG